MSRVISANEVRVYNWSDYIDYSVIDDFEVSTGIEVIYDVFDSNEVLEGKLLAGNTGYDIVGPSIEYLGRQVIAGVHQKLNKDSIPNLRHLEPEMMEILGTMDPGNNYSIPYLWGTTGIGYNQEKPKRSWVRLLGWIALMLFLSQRSSSSLKNAAFAFLDAPSEVFKAALFYLGLDPNTKNPRDYQGEAYELLLKVRPYIKYFHSIEVY